MTQLKEDLACITEDDNGVKGFKKKLLAGVEDRMGWMEGEQQYGGSCSADPRSELLEWPCFDFISRSWASCFVGEQNRIKAREHLIEEVKRCMEVEETEEQGAERRSSSSTPGEEESWEQAAKRRRKERQAEV